MLCTINEWIDVICLVNQTHIGFKKVKTVQIFDGKRRRLLLLGYWPNQRKINKCLNPIRNSPLYHLQT